MGLIFSVICVSTSFARSVRLAEKRVDYRFSEEMKLGSYYRMELYFPDVFSIEEEEDIPYTLEEQRGDLPCKLYWRSGFEFEVNKKTSSFKFFTHNLVDWQGVSLNQKGQQDLSIKDLAEELISGLRMQYTRFGFQADFEDYFRAILQLRRRIAKSTFELEDSWISVNKLPFVGSLKAGKFGEPISYVLARRAEFARFIDSILSFNPFSAESIGLCLDNSFARNGLSWRVGVFNLYTRDSRDSKKDTLLYRARLLKGMVTIPVLRDGKKSADVLKLGVSFNRIADLDEDIQEDIYRKDLEENLDIFGMNAGIALGKMNLNIEYLQTVSSTSEDRFYGIFIMSRYIILDDQISILDDDDQIELAVRYVYMGLDHDQDNIEDIWNTELAVNWRVNKGSSLSWSYSFYKKDSDYKRYVFGARLALSW